ncbi:MAG: hypothetical protein KC431_29145, partial [Myxococcales bacterium]|nr:hypothetical protein [Myxococcales bacterium]
MFEIPHGPSWPIVERHFDELELMFELRGDVLLAPDYDLDELAAGPERRLRQHLFGLIVAGPEALEHVVEPALEDVVLGEALGAAVSLATLTIGTPQECIRVTELLEPYEFSTGERDPEELEAFRRGVIQGMALIERAGVDEWLAAQVSREVGHKSGPKLAGLVTAMAQRRSVPGEILGMLRCDDPRVLQAAALSARCLRDTDSAAALLSLAHHEDPDLRATVIETALVRQLPWAWQAALHWAFQASDCGFRARALTWVALLGNSDVHAHLRERLASRDEPDVASWLWAAGYTGRAEILETALNWIDDPELAPLAAEVCCTIGGAQIDDDSLWQESMSKDHDGLPPLALDDLDADLSQRSEDLLPRPHPEHFLAWWSR